MEDEKTKQVVASISQGRKGRWNWSLTLPNGSVIGGTKLGTMREATKALIAAAKYAGVYNDPR